MSISYLLVLIALAAFGSAVWALFWAIDSGQYDDLEKHGYSALEPDEGALPTRPQDASSNADGVSPGR